jgi:hypothetical protein
MKKLKRNGMKSKLADLSYCQGMAEVKLGKKKTGKRSYKK